MISERLSQRVCANGLFLSEENSWWYAGEDKDTSFILEKV